MNFEKEIREFIQYFNNNIILLFQEPLFDKEKKPLYDSNGYMKILGFLKKNEELFNKIKECNFDDDNVTHRNLLYYLPLSDILCDQINEVEFWIKSLKKASKIIDNNDYRIDDKKTKYRLALELDIFIKFLIIFKIKDSSYYFGNENKFIVNNEIKDYLTEENINEFIDFSKKLEEEGAFHFKLRKTLLKFFKHVIKSREESMINILDKEIIKNNESKNLDKKNNIEETDQGEEPRAKKNKIQNDCDSGINEIGNQMEFVEISPTNFISNKNNLI
jgi:hypothetical protein